MGNPTHRTLDRLLFSASRTKLKIISQLFKEIKLCYLLKKIIFNANKKFQSALRF